MLYIHGGFGGAESTLFPQPSVFSGVLPPDRFQTITYNRRNSGRTEYRNARLNIADLADDARALLDHVGIEQAIILGDSLGGQIAMQFGLSWPERVTSLVLAETGARIVRETLKARLAVVLTSVMPPPLLIKLGRRRAISPPFYDPLGPETPGQLEKALAKHEAYRQALRGLSEAELTRFSMGILRNYACFIGLDMTQRLHELKMPADIIHGTADTVVATQAGQDLQRLIPHARLHLLEGLGHGLFYYPKARNLINDILAPLAANRVSQPALNAEAT